MSIKNENTEMRVVKFKIKDKFNKEYNKFIICDVGFENNKVVFIGNKYLYFDLDTYVPLNSILTLVDEDPKYALEKIKRDIEISKESLNLYIEALNKEIIDQEKCLPDYKYLENIDE